MVISVGERSIVHRCERLFNRSLGYILLANLLDPFDNSVLLLSRQDLINYAANDMHSVLAICYIHLSQLLRSFLFN